MKTFSTDDGLITVEFPQDNSWKIEQICGHQQGPTCTTLLRVKSAAPDTFFFMIAKVYTVPTADILPAHELYQQVIYPNYQKTFEAVKVDLTQPVQHQNKNWYEVAIQMQHAQLGLLAKLERIACEENRVFVVSVEGLQTDVMKWFEVGKRWIESCEFQ